MRGEWEDIQHKGTSYKFDGNAIYVKSKHISRWKNWINGTYPFCRVTQKSSNNIFYINFIDYDNIGCKYFVYKKNGTNTILVKDSVQAEIHNYNNNTIELTPFRNTWQATLVRVQ